MLDDITLAFLPGAKIGVLGPERSRQIDAPPDHGGREEPSSGHAELAAGATAGLLEQEPQLDPEQDVRGNVEDGVRRLRDLLTRFEEISVAFAEPDADFDALIAEQAIVQEQIDRVRRVVARRDDRTRDGRPAPTRRRPGRHDALRRRAPPRCARTAAAVVAGSLAARRAYEPSRRRVGRVARALPRRLCGNRRRGHARPILPRQRRGLDSGARPRQGHPVRGELLGLAGAEAGPARRGGEAGVGAPPRARAGAGMGAGIADSRATRSRRRASRRTRSSSPRRRTSSSTASRFTSPQDHASATSSSLPTGSRRASATGFCSRTPRFRCRPAGSSA